MGERRKRRPLWATVAEKELKEIFRDSRTVLISLVLPLVLFPVLFFTLGEKDFPKSSDKEVFIVLTEGSERIDALIAADQRLCAESLREKGIADALAAGEADVFLRELPYEGKEKRTEAAKGRFLIRYDNSDRQSISAAAYLQSLIEAGERGGAGGQGPVLEPLHDEAEARGRLFLSFVLPFLLFIFSSTCPLPIAGDLSAGEKERESLEPLLSTGVGRGAIVAGKILAALTAGFLSVCAFSAGVYLSYLLSPEIVGGETMTPALPIAAVLLLFLLAFQLTSMYAALELAVGIFTRSSREAQLWGMPILIVSMAAVYAASSFDIRAFPPAALHIPLVNCALVIRQLSRGTIVAEHVLSAGLWMFVYALLAAAAARHLFGREQAIFR